MKAAHRAHMLEAEEATCQHVTLCPVSRIRVCACTLTLLLLLT